MINLSFSTFSVESLSQIRENLDSCLGKREMEEYERFRISKRKDEYLASRIALKKLVLSCDAEISHLNLNQIQVFKEQSGVPYIMIDGNHRLPGWISLSHSAGCVFAGFSPQDIRFGVDIEHIEPRPDEFVTDYFTETEQRFFDTLESGKKLLYLTLAWSIKESFLKAYGIGLNMDTRSLEIDFQFPMYEKQGWRQVKIVCPEKSIPASRIFWTQKGSFVLTICILESSDEILKWV